MNVHTLSIILCTSFCIYGAELSIENQNDTSFKFLQKIQEAESSSSSSSRKTSPLSPLSPNNHLSILRKQLQKNAELLKNQLEELKLVSPFYQAAIRTLERDIAIKINFAEKEKVWKFVGGGITGTAVAWGAKNLAAQAIIRGNYRPSGMHAYFSIDAKTLLIGGLLIGGWYLGYSSIKNVKKENTATIQDTIKTPLEQFKELYTRPTTPISDVGSLVDLSDNLPLIELRNKCIELQQNLEQHKQEYLASMRTIKSILSRGKISLSPQYQEILDTIPDGNAPQPVYEIPQASQSETLL